MERKAQLPVGSLPPSARHYLEQLLQKEVNVLSDEDLAFLKARRMYLSSDQREYYGIDEEKTSDEILSRPVLKAKLRELGVEFNGNSSNEDLKALLEEAQKKSSNAPEGEEEEEDEEEPMLSRTKAKAELKKLDVDFDDNATQEELNELLKEARANS